MFCLVVKFYDKLHSVKIRSISVMCEFDSFGA